MPAAAPDWPGRGAGGEEEGRGGVASPGRGSWPAAASAGAFHVAARPGLRCVHPAWVPRGGGRRELSVSTSPMDGRTTLSRLRLFVKDDVLYINIFFIPILDLAIVGYMAMVVVKFAEVFQTYGFILLFMFNHKVFQMVALGRASTSPWPSSRGVPAVPTAWLGAFAGALVLPRTNSPAGFAVLQLW